MENNLKFEAYESNKIKNGKPVISIISKGIGFSSSFIRKYIPQKPSFVGLRYAQDDENIYIGFSFSNERENIPGAMKITYPKENGLIQCAAFFKKYEINKEEYNKKYDVEEVENKEYGKMFIIKMKK